MANVKNTHEPQQMVLWRRGQREQNSTLADEFTSYRAAASTHGMLTSVFLGSGSFLEFTFNIYLFLLNFFVLCT